MCWRNVIVTGSLETGAVHDAFENSTRSGSGSENEPLVRWPGSDTLSAASPAVEITLAEVEAVYSLSTPGVKGPKAAAGPRVSDSVGGTVPPTGVVASEPRLKCVAPEPTVNVVTPPCVPTSCGAPAPVPTYLSPVGLGIATVALTLAGTLTSST